MSSHFLTDVNCKKYKGFNDFHVENLARVNLIGGKNNVGKTAFMEGCFINVSAINVNSFACTLHSVKFMRENINILTNNLNYKPVSYLEYFNDIDIDSNINQTSFKIEEKDGQKDYAFKIYNKPILVPSINLLAPMPNINYNNQTILLPQFLQPLANTSPNKVHNVIFIDGFGQSNIEIVRNFSVVQKMEQEKYLIEALQGFDEKIESFKVINEIPQCKINGRWLELTELGDGTVHLVSIVTSLFSAKDGYLFIDEIENGVHYTYLKELWKIIFTVSKEVNCQVFATSHSKECIDAFNALNTENIGIYIEFYHNQKKGTKEVKYKSYEQLEYDLTHKGNYRGE